MEEFKEMEKIINEFFEYTEKFIEKGRKVEQIMKKDLQNSIPKKKIKDKIKGYLEYDKKVKTYTSDGRENFTIEYYKAKTLQELLEDK